MSLMARLASLPSGIVIVRTGMVVALLLAGLVVGCGQTGGEEDRVPRPAAEQVEVIDLNKVAVAPAGDDAERPAKARRSDRPAEKVSEDDLASIEDQIRARSSDDAAAPDDGVSPGAPSDDEVRAELRQLKRAKGSIPAGSIKRGSGDLIWPVNGPLTSPFGQRWGRLHAGIDISDPSGTPIRAAAAGQVILMDPTGGYGNYTCIDHGNSISTCYAHQSRFGTSRGATVKQGEVVGYVGNTGNSFGDHLHFEVRVDGQPVDPMDYL